MSDQADNDPTQRLHAACVAAIRRAVEAGEDSDSRFAALGESLFWLIAFAEARGKHKTPGLILGLKWARNRIAHGVLMEEPAQWHTAFTIGHSYVGGPDVLGGGYLWRRSDQIAISTSQRKDSEGEIAYDNELAGRDVLGRVDAGLTEVLGSAAP